MATMPDTLVVDLMKQMRNVTLTIEIKRSHELRVRLWLAARLIHLAGWVAGCRLKVEEIEPPVCEVCGGPLACTITDRVPGQETSARHYCSQHWRDQGRG